MGKRRRVARRHDEGIHRHQLHTRTSEGFDYSGRKGLQQTAESEDYGRNQRTGLLLYERLHGGIAVTEPERNSNYRK